MAVLDEEYPPLPQPSSDTNSYTLGRIGLHNVVITCLPAGQMGTTPAATVATHMQRTFEQIKVGLMVGIGGGVPSTCDIRLGDVVISKPNANANNGGIVQYDFGKHVKQGGYIQTGSLNTPPRLFLTALTKMQAQHQIVHVVEHSKSAILQRLPEQYRHQGDENDQLFQADYEHDGEQTCSRCDSSKLVKRLARGHRGTVIHYGTVASGNSVIKSGVTRDALAKSHEVKCFEMEAAGINAFPYLVIRGICDYSDSHKNKRWQEYAAICAAVCAKELLSLVAPEQNRIETYQYQSYAQTRKTFLANAMLRVARNDDGDADTTADAESEDTADDVLVLPQYLEASIQEAKKALERFIVVPEKSNEEPSPRKVYANRKVVDSINDWYNARDSRILRITGTTENVYPSSTSLIPISLSRSSEGNHGTVVFIRCDGPKTSPIRLFMNIVYSLISHLLKRCGGTIDIATRCQELDGTFDTVKEAFSIISELFKSKLSLTILIDGIERIQDMTSHVDELMALLQESVDIKKNVLKILFTTAGPCRSFQKFRPDALVTVNVDMKKTGGKPVLGTYQIPFLD